MAATHSVVVALLLVVGVLVASVDVQAAEEAKQEVAEVNAGVGARRVLDGVLSVLGVTPTETSPEDAEDAEDTDDDGPEDDENADPNSKNVDAGEHGMRGRGRRKKHHHHHHDGLWYAFYWWAWAFAVVAVKFKVALLIVWGHLAYFIIALIRMLLREVPLWIQLKREPATAYAPQYGPQYGYAAPSNSYGPYKRRAGGAGAAGASTGAVDAPSAAGGGGDMAYGAYGAYGAPSRR